MMPARHFSGLAGAPADVAPAQHDQRALPRSAQAIRAGQSALRGANGCFSAAASVRRMAISMFVVPRGPGRPFFSAPVPVPNLVRDA